MPSRSPKENTYGFIAALAAFVSWGLFPMYWKALVSVDPLEILCNRIVWSLVFISIVLTFKKRWDETFKSLRSRRDFCILALSSIVLGFNWLIYIWAVNTNHILEASLGYFITPLVNILLGFIVFHERLKPLQLLAIALAAAGVANSIISYGEIPWVSLVLAVLFALYGLLRKIATVESLPGLFWETLILAPLALLYMTKLHIDGTSSLFSGNISIDLLLMGAGAVTSLPLIGFAYGARKLQLTALGLLQYSTPSITFLLGVFVYKETFGPSHLLTFGLIWAGLAIYSFESLWPLKNHLNKTQ
ncbi:MAG: EamA family transporter RarD [Pseudodesulfovibrio sp.]|nr:EamA family transporter RarD [Pseudodesulfovibrio sp.]